MLTAAQFAILRPLVLAAPELAQARQTGDDQVIAAWCNSPAVPTFYVWKTSVQTDEIMTNGFDWTRVDNLTVGKARIWEWMTGLGYLNPSRPNVRAGVEATFTVEVADAPNRNAVYGHFQRPATRAEKAFTTGSGTASNTHGVGPADLVWEGLVTGDDASSLR